MNELTSQITLRQPDDWHIHLRDDDALKVTVPHVAAQFGRAIIMPNLRPPVTTVDAAAAYRDRILAARPVGSSFEPLMTLYLTDTTSPEEIAKAKASGFVKAVKLYPAGATTNSDAGVTAIEKTTPALAEMAAQGLPLLVHGEASRRVPHVAAVTVEDEHHRRDFLLGRSWGIHDHLTLDPVDLQLPPLEAVGQGLGRRRRL